MDKLVGDDIYTDSEYDDLIESSINEFRNGTVEAINNWYKNDEFGVIIVEGRQGWGKSCFALLVARHVYDTWKWDVLKRYFAYEPNEFIRRIRFKKKRHPLLVWDDAGNWLNSKDYNTRRVKNACRYFQVARSHWGCILLTCVDAEHIVTDIRNTRGRYMVQIMKSEDETHKTRRVARVFIRWKSPDKTRKGEDEIHREIFYLKDINPITYSNYNTYRTSFANLSIKNMQVDDSI